jgi:hypothetical protein
MEEKRNAYKFQIRGLEERRRFETSGVDKI